MSQSLTQNYIHLVFSTKQRIPCLPTAFLPHLHAYIAGILNSMENPAIIVGGVSDHVHVLFILNKNNSLADVVENLKRSTSKWIKTQVPELRDFSWQAGYGAFSVSQSMISSVKTYISQQVEHHKHESFMEEYQRWLKAYEVKYDEKYL